jgi:crotonobetainyl-CoA:carnitine CoA-transferase CaiB-like acyl-CoA transferase
LRGVDRWCRRPAPALGEHNDEVLGGELGLSAEELTRLRESQVIGDWPAGL